MLILQFYFILFFLNNLGILGLMQFHMNFRIKVSISIVKLSGILIRDCFESMCQFGEFCHLNNIKMYFHSFRSLFCNFQSVSLEFLSFFLSFLSFCYFFGLLLRHMEVTRLGVESGL